MRLILIPSGAGAALCSVICAKAYLFDAILVCSTENSSSQRVPKIGHGDESQLLRSRRMIAACEVGKVVKSTFNLVQEVVGVGKFSDLPNNWSFVASLIKSKIGRAHVLTLVTR